MKPFIAPPRAQIKLNHRTGQGDELAGKFAREQQTVQVATDLRKAEPEVRMQTLLEVGRQVAQSGDPEAEERLKAVKRRLNPN